MPNQINANTDIFKQNQNDVFGDGKDDTTSGNAGGVVVCSQVEGQFLTKAATDGDLSVDPFTINTMANTAGDANIGYSIVYLLRLLPRIVQGVFDKLPALVGGKIPVDTGTATTLAQIRDRTLATATASNTSAANAAATFTIAAPGAGNYIDLAHLYFGYSAAPTAGTLTISATGLTSIVIPVTAQGAGFLPMPIRIPVNTACTVTLAAGGSGVVGRVNASYAVRGA